MMICFIVDLCDQHLSRLNQGERPVGSVKRDSEITKFSKLDYSVKRFKFVVLLIGIRLMTELRLDDNRHGLGVQNHLEKSSRYGRRCRSKRSINLDAWLSGRFRIARAA
jgi:hypothetical protein